jgi:RimK family alpha-L-glutamate ligase
MRYAIVSHLQSTTNDRLVAAPCRGVRWEQLTPSEALRVLRPGDVALGRLDVLPTLDGVDDGLWALGELEARGVRVLNAAAALLAAHDKLLTARLLRRAGLPHPRTRLVRPGGRATALPSPAVVKPRFGSWGRDVVRCDDAASLGAHLERVSGEAWFAAQGALVQELVPPRGYDLRLVVAGRRVVGAVNRLAAPGEWRTNVALGAVRIPARPPADACALAVAAASAAGIDLVGVDLLPTPDGGWTIVELNGAVDFTAEYRPGGDVFAEVGFELVRAALGCPAPDVRRRVAAAEVA